VDAEDIVENKNARILIITPALATGTYHREITTQYMGGGKLLKEPRTALFDRLLTVAQPFAPRPSAAPPGARQSRCASRIKDREQRGAGGSGIQSF
jgi:hypothetical protein